MNYKVIYVILTKDLKAKRKKYDIHGEEMKWGGRMEGGNYAECKTT